MNLYKEYASFSGKTQFYEHQSSATQTKMNFSTFLPCEISEVKSAIIWLSGLTCTEENFITKSGVQSLLSGSSTMIICPDTSPRGLGYAGEDDSYDFGTGAGFYVNATEEPYRSGYQMYDYIVKGLVQLLKDEFKVENLSIMGHSMGGHGALVIGLNEASLFKSVSAFSPIVNPSKCQWGRKAFNGYLGDNEEVWQRYDSCALIDSGVTRNDEILIDQGLSDEFLEEQLLSNNLVEVSKLRGQKLKLRFHEGFDHSYYFIASFLKDHIDFHLSSLT